MASSSYEYYLDVLGTWAGNPALPSQWLVLFHFDTLPFMQTNIQNVLNRKEYGQNWKISTNTKNKLTSDAFNYSLDSMVGCVFAKQVSTPKETINAQHKGLSYGGYTAPATIDARSPYESLNIDFLETNASFVDLFLRPWLIMVSHYGFVARGQSSPKNVKCGQVDVIFFAKTGSFTAMQPRKIFSFRNVAPINIGSETYSHQPDALKVNKVSFVYDKYSVSEGSSNNYVNKNSEGMLTLMQIFNKIFTPNGSNQNFYDIV
jgi:hypothetical protein